jgi:hypothetical protein
MTGKTPRPPNKGVQTTPQGHEIPIPKKGDFLRDLRKAATPKPAEKPEG